MISTKEYYNNPEYRYEDIADLIDKYVNEGLEKVGGAKVILDPNLKSGKVDGGEFPDGSGRWQTGCCAINPHYCNELIYRIRSSGLIYEPVRGGDFNRVTHILITLY